MKNRCARAEYKRSKHYANVTIDPSWLRSFEAFLADMGECPDPQYSLDRVDLSKGYTADNCRWLIKSEQAQNTSRTVWVVYGGKKVCFSEACRLAGLDVKLVDDRVRRLGWPMDKALATPKQTRGSGPKRKTKHLKGDSK